MSIEFLVFWFFCGVVSAMVGSSKGKGVFTWFLVGFILGPIGLVISLVSGKNESVVEEKALNTGTVKKCPFCAELIKQEAIICKHCGKEQTLESPSNLSGELHKKFQDAIYKNDLELIKTILKEGINLNECGLPMSHIEYAELYGNDEIMLIINSAIK